MTGSQLFLLGSLLMLCDLTTLSGPGLASPAADRAAAGAISTFSIVARDAGTGELGIAVASRFFAEGAVVPWARAGVGAVATQYFAGTTFGWRGLDLLEQGATPEEVADILIWST